MTLLAGLFDTFAASLRGSAAAIVLDQDSQVLDGLGDSWELTSCATFDELLALAESSDADIVGVVAIRSGASGVRAHGDGTALLELVEALARRHQSDRHIVVLLPGRVLGSPKYRRSRERLNGLAYPRTVVEGPLSRIVGSQSTWQESLGALVVFGTGQLACPPTRFFQLDPEDVDDLAQCKQLARLLGQAHGHTTCGWVYEEVLDVATSIASAPYRPELERLRSDLAEMGDVVRLAEVCTLVPPVSGVEEEAGILERSVPVLQAREIDSRGRIRPLVSRVFAAPAEMSRLRAGDLCVRRAVGDGDERLAIAEIDRTWLPLCADSGIAALRLSGDVEEALRPFLVDFLRSVRALEMIRPHTGRFELTDESLMRLDVPLPGRALRTALSDLWRNEKVLGDWIREVRAIRRSIVDSVSEPTAAVIPRVLRDARRVSQKTDAAKAMDDLPTRLRQRLPYPLATGWRAIWTGEETETTYRRTLEFAELTVAYLAVMALACAQKSGAKLAATADLAQRVVKYGHAFAWGDWLALMDEVSGVKYGKAVGDAYPVPELLTSLPPDSDARVAVARLVELRNALAHNKGPHGAELAGALEAARGDVQVLLAAAEFLTEYPLRLVIETQWDGFESRAIYTYRDLIGDHLLVPKGSAATSQAGLESHSLYAVVPGGDLLLLRPLLLRETCPECGVDDLFLIDLPRPDGPSVFRALDHGHTLEADRLQAGFRSIGLLPPL